ncbi:peptidyl-prolyl cis-trans isomerase B-like [Amphiura filiformis]|uniref:peptidyl-prolyl cis-trans isomerase B-like n=1 Tax=Amphiura filiformis TaxID=82378 RepID=UPI003B210849
MANKTTVTLSILGTSFLLVVMILAELGAAQYPTMPYATKRAGKKKQPWNDGHDKENDLLVTKKAFFDIAIDDEPIGRIVIGLFGETCPVTVQNFAALTRGNFKNDKKLSYNNTIVHRLVQDFVIQMGDVVEMDGSGGRSIYGQYFADENFYLRHWGPGWVAMANSGPDSNNSQFIILLSKARWLDGKHVVFGKILEGMDVVLDMADVDTDDFAFPTVPIQIVDCGIISVKEPFKLDNPDDVEKKERRERRSKRKANKKE